MRQGVRHDHQAMHAAAGRGFIVILRNEFRDGLGEFVAESRPVRRRPEANLRVHRERRQASARLIRPTNEVAHLAHDTRAQCDEIARRQPIDFSVRLKSTLKSVSGRTFFCSKPSVAFRSPSRRISTEWLGL